MNETVAKVVKRTKKALKRMGMPYWAVYEAEEVWGITNGKEIKFLTL